MKNILRVCAILFIFLLALNACKKDKETVEQVIIKEKLSGYVQKGPFVNGTSIEMYELDHLLDQTGNTFSTQISNNNGLFEINQVKLSSKYVELSAYGYYYNEVLGKLSVSPLNLMALSDILDISSLNVNILTHLEKQRVDYLVIKNKTFSEAKTMAQMEVLGIFGFSLSEISNSEKLDITINGEGNAILLAISIILQGNRSVGDLTELLANISNDVREDGVITNNTIINDLRNSTKTLDLQAIRTNLNNRYVELGSTATIPEFEKYINSFLAFTAEKPTASSEPASEITQTSVKFNGLVNANSLPTTVIFEWGKTLAYSDSIPISDNPLSGSTSKTVGVVKTGLVPGETFHYRVKAKNSLGISYGEDKTFRTLGDIPIITQPDVNSIRTTTAILKAEINPNSLRTEVTFEYGTTMSYGSAIIPASSPLEGNSSISVSSILTGLIPGEIYHFRVKAVNELGEAVSNDMTFSSAPLLTDIDGNTYNTVYIGNQLWMAENLKTTKYADGTGITQVNSENWNIVNINTDYYSWYNNDENNKDIYGALYSWGAAMKKESSSSLNPSGVQGVCPTGWHLPSNDEWVELRNYIGGNGGKLKETGTLHWLSPNNEATNETGFSALPGGWRFVDGAFAELHNVGWWWSSTEWSTNYSGYWSVVSYNASYTSGNYYKHIGLSVRCVMN